MSGTFRICLSLAVAASVSLAGRAAEPSKVTIHLEKEVITLPNAIVETQELWIPAEDLPRVTGFSLKPEGLCSAARCVPVSENLARSENQRQYVSLTRVATRLGQPLVADAARRVWAVGAVESERPAKLELGEAPDFAVPDRTGKIVHLHDFRGKKVFLLTWASWCGCSMDLPGWEKVYSELRDKNFELIAAAQDTAPHAADRFYDRAKATFTTLVDPEHQISALYQMVNVPTGVWIDEAGHIVRPPEVAYSKQYVVLGQKIGDDQYVPALRDWVLHGNESSFVMSKPSLGAKLAPRSPEKRLAELHFRLGAYLFAKGDRAGAREHWQMAQKLDVDNWNYHRQDWSFQPGEAMVNWLKKVRALGNRPYYEPVEWAKPKDKIDSR